MFGRNIIDPHLLTGGHIDAGSFGSARISKMMCYPRHLQSAKIIKHNMHNEQIKRLFF